MDIHCIANGEKNGASFRESFRRRNCAINEAAFFYPSDLVNTKTTIPLTLGEERWIYTSIPRVLVYIHHYSPPLRGIVAYYTFCSALIRCPVYFRTKQEQNFPHFPDLRLTLQLFSNPKMEDSIKQLITLFSFGKAPPPGHTGNFTIYVSSRTEEKMP